MEFSFTEVFLPGNVTLHEDHVEGTITLCLDDETWQEDYGAAARFIYIVDPLEDSLENLNPLQDYLLHIPPEGTPSLPDFFGVTLEDITQMAQENSHICLVGSFSEE
jgi:hypothetical protein